jgi:opacity protein-like surface antigen
MKNYARNLARQSFVFVAGCIIASLPLAVPVVADQLSADHGSGQRLEDRAMPRSAAQSETRNMQRDQIVYDDETRASARYENRRGSGGILDYSTRFVKEDEWCQWKSRLSLGVPVWFFDEESDLPGAGAYLDFWRTDIPLNFRVGFEGRHMYLSQESAEYAMEWFDKTTRISFYRIPFALEYMHGLTESTTLYLGGGPNVIRTANDISDWSVGMHLSGRLHYGFNDRWGVALEAGYMWGEIDGQDGDIVLDNAFVTPTLTYTF